MLYWSMGLIARYRLDQNESTKFLSRWGFNTQSLVWLMDIENIVEKRENAGN